MEEELETPMEQESLKKEQKKRQKPSRDFSCMFCAKQGTTTRKKKQFCSDVCRSAWHNREKENVNERLKKLEEAVFKDH